MFYTRITRHDPVAAAPLGDARRREDPCRSADNGGGIYVSEKGEIFLDGPNDISHNTGHGVRGTAGAAISARGRTPSPATAATASGWTAVPSSSSLPPTRLPCLLSFLLA
jgi:hypothetical protein